MNPTSEAAVESPLLAAALEYARRGWRVLPLHSVDGESCSCEDADCCKSPGKHPRNTHGLKEASADPAIIAGWWRRWPDANVGIATGAESGLVVLDVDPKSGGPDSLRQLLEQHGGWLTVTAVTGSGGIHALFRHPGQQLRNSASKVGRGIDVRGDGGYIVAAPSLHASGASYAWAEGRSPDEAELAEMPAWLLELATATRKKASAPVRPIELPADARLKRARAWLSRRAPAIEGSGGDQHTFTTAAELRGFGLSEDEAFSLLVNEWNDGCSPPWDHAELREKVRNAYRYATGTPGEKLAERQLAPRSGPRQMQPERAPQPHPNAPASGPGPAPAEAPDPVGEAKAFLGQLPKLIQNDPRAPLLPESLAHLTVLHGEPEWLQAKGILRNARCLQEVTAAIKLAKRSRRRIEPAEASEGTLVDPKAPLTVARQFLASRFEHFERTTLLHHRGDWRYWCGTHYRLADPAEVKRQIYEFLENASIPADDDSRPCRPNKKMVEEIFHALVSIAFLDGAVDTPCWFGEGPDPRRLVAMRNGVLELDSLELYGHSPELFNTHALPFDYDPGASAPESWLRFLASLWPTDNESIGTLQEMFGYFLSGDTSQHKVFMLIGDKRSGKGTIARVLTRLIGAANVASPTLSGLTTNFGLQVLLDKPLALISDARLSARVDQTVVVERLLAISGEDAITVDRKHKAPITVQLPSRFLILTNELPKLVDGSGAMASRFIMLDLPISWLGREDKGLLGRLLPELPGILNWALEGYARLQQRGRFVQPDSAAELIQEFVDMGAPVQQFVREQCVLEHGASVSIDRLFDAWRNWCGREGRDHPGTKASFGRDLRAAVPGLKTGRPWGTGGERPRSYLGIRLRDVLLEARVA